jgi:hypothetical protein
MNSTIQEWLEKRTLPPGILAMGFCQPDGGLATHSLDPLCLEPKMEGILEAYAAQRALVLSGDLAPRWCTWVFERGVIRYVERPDGWLMGLVVTAESQAQSILDTLAQEFLALELGQ